MADFDMENRDPNSINRHVQVAFSDVIAEPDGAHSADCVWRNIFCCYECGKNSSYRMMTFFCGMCIALYWGCEFAFITFNQVWCVTPSLRMLSISITATQKFLSVYVNCCLAPICETCGLCFSRITVVNK